MGILWEIVIPICGNPMGIPTEILWEWDGNGNENSLPTATLACSHSLVYGIHSALAVSGFDYSRRTFVACFAVHDLFPRLFAVFSTMLEAT